MEQVGRPQNAVFQLADVAQGSGEGSLQIVLKQNLDNPKHTIGRFRLYAITTPQPVRADQSPPPEISALLQIARDQRTPEQNDQIAKHYRTIAPELAPQREQLAALQRDLDALNRQIPRTLVTKRVEPRVVRMLPRGNWMDESGEVVQPTIPVMLGGGTPPADRRLNRLDLAKWVVAAENPLTSRATVNRVWKLFFGAGLSRKLDDLGAQGEWPSHPQLLDALAIDFINSGWNIKHLVKQIVMSETYRQSSVASAQVAERDPYNRWLSHQSRWRLDAEFVRDNALTISDLLVKQVGGNSVKPYQPAGYWAYLNFPQREWQNGQGAELYRRGLYTHWQRQYLHPSLVAFDAPNREECTADRPRSNTPLQALVLLNDPTYVEAARVFAEHAIRNGGSSPADRVQWMFVKAMNRQAKPVELERLVKIVEQHRSQYAQDTAARDQVLAIGAAPIDSAIDKQELAAWVSVARVLLNLHETITRN